MTLPLTLYISFMTILLRAIKAKTNISEILKIVCSYYINALFEEFHMCGYEQRWPSG